MYCLIDSSQPQHINIHFLLVPLLADDSVVKVTNPLVTLTANTEPNFMMEVPLEILKSGQAALSLELVDPNILEVVKLGGENTEKEITVGIDCECC